MQSCINITSSIVHFLCVKHSHTLYRYLHVYFAFYLMISDYTGMWASFITLSLYCMNKVNSTFLVSWMKADEQTCSWTYSNSVAETKMLPLLTQSLTMRLMQTMVTWQRILLGLMSSVESSYRTFTFVLRHVKRSSPLIFQIASSLCMWLV